MKACPESTLGLPWGSPLLALMGMGLNSPAMWGLHK